MPRRSVVAAPVVPSAGSVRSLGIDEVVLRDGFWGSRQSINGTRTLDHCVGWLDRLGWLANFDLTATVDEGARAGREFADSETYKILEALAWESGRTGDPHVEQTYRALAARVIAAQSPDGYLNTRFGGSGQPARWSDLEWGHELYCAGHLVQAAVARLRTAGEDDLVRAALKVADHVVATFGPGGIESVCGHPEIEIALVELARTTGRAEYLEQARLFVERRGRGLLGEIEFGAEYFQDDVPVREATTLRGHAVRALYLSAGAVDLAVETDDVELLAALERQWEGTVAARTYVTGGMGSRHTDESFGLDHELPPDRAYCETCAGIAAVMFSWRLFLATGRMRYADLVERVLYNVVATSPSQDGTAFFYANPLHQREHGHPVDPEGMSPRASSSERAPWFAVSCCPTNVARTFASLGAYVAAWRQDSLVLAQYAAGRVVTTSPGGEPVVLEVRTAYPAHGVVEIHIDDAPAGLPLLLRVPAWARGRATLSVDGRAQDVDGDTARANGLRAGSVVRLELPVAPRWTFPDPRIDAVRGCVAVEAGPVVLCLESVGLPEGTDLNRARVDTSVAPQPADGGAVAVRVAFLDPPAAGWPYGDGDGGRADAGEVVLLHPYHQWGERGPTQMRVWVPVLAPGAVPRTPVPSPPVGRHVPPVRPYSTLEGKEAFS